MNELFKSGSVYTVKEVAKTFGVSRVTVLRAIHGGRLRAVRVEGQYRVLGGDAIRYVEGTLGGLSLTIASA